MKTYLNIVKERGEDYFKATGFGRRYFIFATNTIPVKTDEELMRDSIKIPIYNPRGDEAFDIYIKDLY